MKGRGERGHDDHQLFLPTFATADYETPLGESRDSLQLQLENAEGPQPVHRLGVSQIGIDLS
jgi:hypothetical protein